MSSAATRLMSAAAAHPRTVSSAATRLMSAAAAPELSYADKKKNAKEIRRQTFQRHSERQAKLKTRRDHAPKDVLKTQFRSWFDQFRTRNETMDRKARQAGLPWKVRVAAVVERLPVVLPDKPQWEQDFEDLSAYLGQFGREYPKEFMEFKGGATKESLSYEELLELLPEGYKPAPRETEADATGEVKTLERKLKERVYLTVQEKGSNGFWAPFPTSYAKEDETLLDTAKRATSHAVGSNLELWCPSNCPMAVDMYKFKEPKDHFGIKTFFIRVQLDDGDVDPSALNVDDFAWLARDEVVDRIKEQRGDVPSKLYHYLL